MTFRQLNAVTDLRRTCADVVTLADLIIYGTEVEVHIAQQKLPARVRLLKARVDRALATLEEGQG